MCASSQWRFILMHTNPSCSFTSRMYLRIWFSPCWPNYYISSWMTWCQIQVLINTSVCTGSEEIPPCLERLLRACLYPSDRELDVAQLWHFQRKTSEIWMKLQCVGELQYMGRWMDWCHVEDVDSFISFEVTRCDFTFLPPPHCNRENRWAKWFSIFMSWP